MVRHIHIHQSIRLGFHQDTTKLRIRAPSVFERFLQGTVKLLLGSRFTTPTCTVEITCHHFDVFLYYSSSDCNHYILRNAAFLSHRFIAVQRHDCETRPAFSWNASEANSGHNSLGGPPATVRLVCRHVNGLDLKIKFNHMLVEECSNHENESHETGMSCLRVGEALQLPAEPQSAIAQQYDFRWLVETRAWDPDSSKRCSSVFAQTTNRLLLCQIWQEVAEPWGVFQLARKKKQSCHL